MSHFSIASLQLELSTQDNRYLIQKEIEMVKKTYPWVEMVVLGELSTFGPGISYAQRLPSDAETFYCEIAEKYNLWLIPGTLYEKSEDKIYNTCPVINPNGEVVDRYRKMFPFEPYEKGVTAGDKFVVFDVPNVGRFGLCICYDQWFPEISRTLAWMGAEVILCPTMTNTIERDVELTLARANAVTSQTYMFNINVAGKVGKGRSIVVGPDGQVIYEAGNKGEVIPIEINLDHVKRVRERGMLGLGQTLKSFRDSKVTFPPYVEGHDASETFRDLGELTLPARDTK